MAAYQKYNGVNYYLDDGGYFKKICQGTSVYIHRVVYVDNYGAIPEGYHIHHKDHDKSNNSPTNLEAVSAKDHREHHEKHITDDRKAARLKNFHDNARPAAIEWHKSNEGREWHKKHYDRMKVSLHELVERQCRNCGKVTETQYKRINAFCSNSCKSAYRRKTGADDVEKTCVICDNVYMGNKYAKSKTCSRSCAMRLRARNMREVCGKG